MTLKEKIVLALAESISTDPPLTMSTVADKILSLIHEDLDEDLNLGRCPTCGRRVED